MAEQENIPEGQNQEAPQGQTAAPEPETKTPDPAPALAADNKEPDPAPAPAADWKDKRIAQLTAKLREVEKAPKAAAPVQPPNPGVVAMPGTPEFQALVDAEANKKAGVVAQVQAFNAACDATAAEGRKVWQDFDSRVANLQKLVDGTNPAEVQLFNNFLAAAIETGEGPKVIYELGGDLNEAHRILTLPPIKMGVALVKLAVGQGPAREISGAPKPIKPVGNTNTNVEARPDDPDQGDRLSTAEWMKRRNAQVDQKFARR
jgi:hypothetical protein